jgi:hypothetical protein
MWSLWSGTAGETGEGIMGQQGSRETPCYRRLPGGA